MSIGIKTKASKIKGHDAHLKKVTDEMNAAWERCGAASLPSSDNPHESSARRWESLAGYLAGTVVSLRAVIKDLEQEIAEERRGGMWDMGLTPSETDEERR